MVEADRQGWTLDELIRFAFKGKQAALARYDSILWKIRSGYVLVLYGAIGLVGGRDIALSGQSLQANGRVVLLVLAVGVSVSAFLVDLGFIRAKLRVISDMDDLYCVMLRSTLDPHGHPLSGYEATLSKTLRISGDTTHRLPKGTLRHALMGVVPIYTTSPILGAAAVLILAAH